MQIIFILFFTSLLGIIVMIGRKMRLAQNGLIARFEDSHPLIPDVEKVKELLYSNSRKAGYLALVGMIRLHLKSSKLAKQKYGELKMSVKNKLMKEPGSEFGNTGTEASGFLKLISDYKHKVRRLKRKIHEEEK